MEAESFEDLAVELIELVYAAVEEPGRAETLIERLASTTGAGAAAVFLGARQTRRFASGADPMQARTPLTYFECRRAGIGGSILPRCAGEVIRSEERIEDSVLSQSEVAGDTRRPGDAHHAICATTYRDRKIVATLAILRPSRCGPFDAHASRIVRLLAPHLRRALQLQNQVAEVRAEREATAAILDRVPAGVILLDAEARPLLINQTGREILASGDGLSLDRESLAAATPGESAVLRNLIRDAVAISAGRSILRHGAGTLAVSRPSRRRSYLVFVTPLAGKDASSDARRPAAAVFLTDPERKMPAPAGLLREAYRFTPAEAQIAEKLIQGESLDEAARDLDITINTARTHLRHLFHKTDTNRHWELVRILLLALATLPPAA